MYVVSDCNNRHYNLHITTLNHHWAHHLECWDLASVVGVSSLVTLGSEVGEGRGQQKQQQKSQGEHTSAPC
jgi:hypothetical protein